MEFTEITDNSDVSAGEYLYHHPTGQIGVCGQASKSGQMIKVLIHGRIVEDVCENFKKIQLNKKEKRERRASGCSGCKGR